MNRTLSTLTFQLLFPLHLKEIHNIFGPHLSTLLNLFYYSLFSCNVPHSLEFQHGQSIMQQLPILEVSVIENMKVKLLEL